MYWHIETDIITLIVIFALYIYASKLQSNQEPPLQNRRFIWCLKTGLAVTVIDIAASIIMEISVPPLLYHSLMMLYYITIDLVIIAWLYYAMVILYPSEEKIRRKLSILMLIPFAVYVLLVCSNPWSGLFFQLGADNSYQRGEMFFLMIVVYALYSLLLLGLIVLRRKHISADYPVSVLVLIPFILSISIVLQSLNPGWLMILPGYMICLVLVFLFLQNVRDKSEQAIIHRLNELVENFSCGLAICTVDQEHKLEIQYLNKGYSDICEDTSDSLNERYDEDILSGIHPEDQEMVQANLDDLVATFRDHEMTYRFITNTGSLKWINVKTKVVRNADGTASSYSTYTDLTEQIKLRSQLSDVIDTVPCGICLYRWDGKKLHLLLANHQFTEMLGTEAINQAKDLGGLDYSLVHPDDLVALKTATWQGLEKSKEIDHTFRILNASRQQYLWVRVRGVLTLQPDGTQLVYLSYYDVSQEHLNEQKLRESEQALEYATAQAGLWYWKYDATQDRVFPDKRSQLEFNLPPVMNNFLEDWLPDGSIHPDYVDIYRESCLRIKQGEKQVIFEAQNYSGDRTLHWSRYCITNLYDSEGRISIAVGTTVYIDVEKELWAKYELERKRKSLDNEKLIVHAVFNLTSGETLEYFYRDGTEVPLENRDFTYDQKNVDELLIDEEERRQFRAINNKEALLEHFAQGRTEFKLEYRRLLREGEIHWIRIALRMVRNPRNSEVLLFAYWYDIEEEKMRKLMYHSLASDNYDYIARINGRNKHFVIYPKTGLNYRIPPLRGEDADLNTQTVYQKGIFPEDKEMVINNTLVANIKKNLRQQGRFQFTYREIQPDNRLLYKKITQYYLDPQREIIIMTREDVTEVIQVEAEKNEMLASALAVANQASLAKSQFLSRVSHELRTPLNAIIGFMELAKGAEASQIEAYLANSNIAAKQLLAIINDVLDMSSIESGKLKISYAPFDFKHLLHSLTNIYVSQCHQKGLSYATKLLTPIDEWLVGDKLRVNQILLNLLNNAVKFTSHGHIWLKVSQIATQKPKQVFIRFEISDTGCGMNETMLERLFQPFEQESAMTAQKYGGNGLGLSIVNNLVKMMNGVIRVESQIDQGSSFIVDLPFIKSEAEIALQSIDGVESLYVLAVDDESNELDYISIVLSRIGVRHNCVLDGDEALAELEQASSQNDPYNICLIDWKMPNMNGIETTRRIRQKYGKNVVVIVVSAYDHHQANESAKEAGANIFISKPLFQSSLFDLFMSLTGGHMNKPKAIPLTSHFSSKRVLLAEDNVMNRMVAEGLLNKLGIVCDYAEDGKITFDRFLAAEPGYYDAILMDIQMPVLNGFEATKAIRESAHSDAKNIQIIALTANAFNEDIAKTLSSGMNDHVAKPIEPELLALALEKAFKQKD